MSEQQGLLSGHSGLITATIRQKQQTFYLVTDESLAAIKEKSVIADVLMLITSLLFGAFFSVFIALKAAPDIPQPTVDSLSIYQSVFLVFGCIFLVMTVIAVVMGHKLIGNVTKSEATISENMDEQS